VQNFENISRPENGRSRKNVNAYDQTGKENGNAGYFGHNMGGGEVADRTKVGLLNEGRGGGGHI